jgi:hypothetical protein
MESRSARNMRDRRNIGTGAETVALLDRIWAKVRTFAKTYAETDLPAVQMVTGTGQFGMPRGSVRLGSVIPDFWTHRNGNGNRPTRVAEFFVSGETLGRGAEPALTTILHEATHVLCMVRRSAALADMLDNEAQAMLAETAGDVTAAEAFKAAAVAAEAEAKRWKDTTRQNRYHNGNFRDHAATFGLEYVHGRANEDVGYSAVTLSEMGAILWGEELAELERLTPAYIDMEFVPVTSDPADDRVRVAPVGGTDDNAEPPTPRQNRRTYRCGCNRSILAYPTDMAEAPVTCGRCGGDFE